MIQIKLENVSKTIKDALVLNDVSASFEGGKIYGLRGKNGSGKTMLMRAISGLMFPSSGRIYFNDKELHKDIDFPPSMGLLIENPSFLSNLTGYKNLKLIASLSDNISSEDVSSAIERVGLDPNDTRTYKKYSLGMKQRLGIANAIMGEPDLIILDEPINALDEESVTVIKNILIELRDKGKLIIVACHDREELEFLSDVIYEINTGKIVNIVEV